MMPPGKPWQRGSLRTVHEHCLAILQIDPTFADAWFLCGVVAAHNGLLSKSIEIFEKATALAPDNPEYHAELGKQLLADQQPERALQEAKKTLQLSPSQLTTINTLGSLLSHVGEHEKALSCFERAVRSLQQRAGGRYEPVQQMAGGPLLQLRCLSAICRLLRGGGNCIRTSPSAYYRRFSKHTRLCLRYANKPRMITISAALMRYAKRLSAPVTNCILGTPSPKNRKTLVVLKRLSTAWSGRSKRKHARSTTVETKATGCSPASGICSAQVRLRGAKKGHDTNEPIFIVGMPRTGTTLTEQVLSSHSQVFAAGELQLFPLQVKRSVASTATDLFDLETVCRIACYE